MDAAAIIRQVRLESGLSLRALAGVANTSHSTIAAYESGRKVPGPATLDRIVEATGFALDGLLSRRVRAYGPLTRGEELVAVLELAEAFPSRHDPSIAARIFGR